MLALITCQLKTVTQIILKTKICYPFPYAILYTDDGEMACGPFNEAAWIPSQIKSLLSVFSSFLTIMTKHIVIFISCDKFFNYWMIILTSSFK